MPLYIKNERVDRLARQVVEVADESLAIRARCKALPVLNCSDPASVLGYDDQGLPR